MITRLSLAGVVLLLLAGCAAAPEAPETAELEPPTPAPVPTAIVEVPTADASLQPVRAAVPPVRVQIPSSGVDVPVQPVGIEPDGLLELPEDITVAGWYKYGSDPLSNAGSTLIAAHLDSLPQGIGPFVALKSLTPGTEVLVSTADGGQSRYQVSSVQNIGKTQLPLGELFDRAGSPRVVLVTCGGPWSDEIGNYTENVIVIADPVA